MQINQANRIENNITISLLMDLARCLWLKPATRPQVVKHARAASGIASKVQGIQDNVREEVTTWLAKHRLKSSPL